MENTNNQVLNEIERVSDCLEERYFGSLFATECERFGMMHGCREDCPVFQEGKCEQQEENEKLFTNA